MNDKNFLAKIINRLFPRKRSLQPGAARSQDLKIVEKLYQMAMETDEVEMSCEDVYDLLDQYVELELRGEDVSQLLPLVKRHLERCSDCFDEYEALMRVVSATSSFHN